MRVIDFIPHVIAAIGTRIMSQTELTEAVWGSSGRNNPRLVNLLNHMVERKMLNRSRHGRTKLFTRGPNAPAVPEAIQREMDELRAMRVGAQS